MRILQSFTKLDGSVAFVIGANRAVLSISKDEITKLSLPQVGDGDSSVAYVTNIITADGSIFATFDDKVVSKWDLSTQTFSGSVTLKKKVNAIAHGTVEGQHIIIVGDKVGDTWGFNSRQMQSLGYLGGHPVTIITDVTINQANNLMASCDRDEKVKISSFPIVEEVRGYLLAHKSVVTSVSFVDTDGQFLVSAGWDHKVILWNTSTFAPIDEFSFKETDIAESTASAAAVPEEPIEEKITEDAGAEDGEEEVKEKDYNEASAGNYPFKVVVSSSGLVAVLCKNEKKVSILRASTSGDNQGLELVHTFSTPAQPVDCSFISATELAIVFPHPYYLRVFSLDADSVAQDITTNVLSDSVIESFTSLLGESFNPSVLFKSLGFEDDKNLMRDTLENPVRDLPKGGHLPNKKRRK